MSAITRLSRLYFNMAKISYLEIRLFNNGEEIKRILVANKGQKTIKIKPYGAFELPDMSDTRIFRCKLAKYIDFDTSNIRPLVKVKKGEDEENFKKESEENTLAFLKSIISSKNATKEEIEEKEKRIKDAYYYMLHNTVNPRTFQEILEADTVGDIMSTPEDIWTALKTPIIIACIVILIIYLSYMFL